MDPSATVTVPVEEESALESQEDAELEKNRALFFAAGHIGEDPKGGVSPGPTFARVIANFNKTLNEALWQKLKFSSRDQRQLNGMKKEYQALLAPYLKGATGGPEKAKAYRGSDEFKAAKASMVHFYEKEKEALRTIYAHEFNVARAEQDEVHVGVSNEINVAVDVPAPVAKAVPPPKPPARKIPKKVKIGGVRPAEAVPEVVRQQEVARKGNEIQLAKIQARIQENEGVVEQLVGGVHEGVQQRGEIADL